MIFAGREFRGARLSESVPQGSSHSSSEACSQQVGWSEGSEIALLTCQAHRGHGRLGSVG